MPESESIPNRTFPVGSGPARPYNYQPYDIEYLNDAQQYLHHVCYSIILRIARMPEIIAH